MSDPRTQPLSHGYTHHVESLRELGIDPYGDYDMQRGSESDVSLESYYSEDDPYEIPLAHDRVPHIQS